MSWNAALAMMGQPPSMGHVNARGFWHPGSADGCCKCEPEPCYRCRKAGRAYDAFCDWCLRRND